jgi:D-beta-D-heptose 7-phosphate kinase/D-beta-D-heptose 1-phosphate adenosyltransferase
MTDQTAFPALPETLDRVAGVKVVVVGDIMLDRFVYGDVNRISPEAPIPVLKVKNEIGMLGGAGNVLSNLHGLDVKASVIAVVGADAPAETLKTLVREKGASPDLLIVAADRPTTIKTRFMAARQQLLRTDSEQSDAVNVSIEDKIIAAASAALKDAGALILSDYGKGVLTPRVLTALVAAAGKQAIPVLVDPKGGDYSIYRGATAVTPNRKELAQATGGMDTSTDAAVVAACRVLMKQAGVENIVATRSQDGMSVVPLNGNPMHLRTEALEVFDVSGAGDTVIAVLAAVLATGASLQSAAAIANAAGGIVVAKVGTAAIRRGELHDVLVHKDLALQAGTDGPAILDRVREALAVRPDEALDIVRRWQARGLKVGLTNGCFDIVHPGHVGYLNRARDKCDRLVVGLNSDASVRRLKGASRPVNDENARGMVMAALGSVDLVVLFGDDPADEDKASRLVGLLRPDIYFKGADYKEEQIPEAKIARGYGGDVYLVPLYEGHSTTATISRMKG